MRAALSMATDRGCAQPMDRCSAINTGAADRILDKAFDELF
jgi:hypothetical protein